MSSQPPTGAARNWTEQQLGGPCTEEQTSVNVQTSITQLAFNDSEAVGITFINGGAADVWISLTSNAAVGVGILLAQSGGFASFNLRDDFTIVTRDWYAVSNGLISAVTVIKTKRITRTTEDQ